MRERHTGGALELLLCCSGPAPDPGRVVELLQTPIDWVEVFRLGLLHGGLPRLCRCLAALASPKVPRATLTALSRYTASVAARNRAITVELLEVLSALKAAGVEAAPFKGPTLASRLYGELDSRQFGDLDILVRRRDVPAAEAVLASRGYRPWQALSPEAERRCLEDGKDRPFVSRDGHFAVEIHWRFTPRYYPFALDAESVWERLEMCAFQGTRVLSIPAEELLLILCVHGARHRWSSLKWVCDVAFLLSVERDLDWTEILRQARYLRVERILLTGLCLAGVLLDTALPAEVRAKIGGDSTARRLAEQASEGFHGAVDWHEEGLPACCFQVALRERLQDRLALLAHYAGSKMRPLRGDRAAPGIPGSAYLRRAARLIHRYGLSNWRGLLRSTAGRAMEVK
jgi:hypothetical protein